MYPLLPCPSRQSSIQPTRARPTAAQGPAPPEPAPLHFARPSRWPNPAPCTPAHHLRWPKAQGEQPLVFFLYSLGQPSYLAHIMFFPAPANLVFVPENTVLQKSPYSCI
ncbi:hypothetical protein VPH35_104972 [Triticum aestivum]